MQPNKKRLYTLGFTATEQFKVLPAGAGWEDSYQLVATPLPQGAVTEQSGTYSISHAILQEHEAAGRAGAAIVAPVAQQQQIIQQLRTASRTLFVICWHPNATEDASMRWQAFEAGANMVTHCTHAVAAALQQVSAQQQQQQQQGQKQSGTSGLQCDWCGLPGLSAAEYWQHQQLYHINHANKAGVCQICNRYTQNLASHLHHSHDPTGQPLEQRTGVFALCIVRRSSDGKMLMTQEFAGSGFWVPGGGVNPGETLMQGAVRECREEAGVEVTLKGILSIEQHHRGAWRRITFYAEPAATAAAGSEAEAELGAAAAAAGTGLEIPFEAATGQQQQQQVDSTQHSRVGPSPCCSPKTLPDWESAGACWVSVQELQQLPLRNATEPCRWFPVLAGGIEGLEAELPWINSLQLPQEWLGVFWDFPCSRN